MDKLYKLCEKLNNELKDDPRIIDLNIREENMENNEQAMKLSYIKDLKEIAYSDNLKHFKEDDEEIIKSRKELYLAKKELDSLPVVQEYLKSYKIVRKLYEKINDIIFSDMVEKKGKICE